MYGQRGSKSDRARHVVGVVSILLWAAFATAQMEVGDNTKLNLNGNLGYGYSGGFGNADISSMHSNGLTGNADLSGYYFHPNFLSFDMRPYYDRSSVSSDSQVVSRSSGVGASVNFFGGSRFPGSISFGKDFSAGSEFRFAGVPSLEGDSSGQNFSVGWSALIPKYPTLTVSYGRGSNESSISGLSPSTSSASNLNFNSGYQWLGFNLNGTFSHSSSNFTSPQYTSAEPIVSDASGNTYGFSVQHALPARGGISFSAAHSAFSNSSGTDWNTTSYSESGTISPFRRLSLYQNLTFTDNLSVAFAQSVLGGVTSTAFLPYNNSSQGLFAGAGANVQISHNLTLGGHFNHRIQWLANERYQDTQFGGNLNYNYNHRLFGLLYFGLGVVDTASKYGNDGAGLSANVGMSKKFGHYETSADFSYSQDLQTLITVMTTSSYNYGVSVRRRLNQDTSFGGSFRSMHSALVVQAGSGNSSQSAGGGLSWKKYNFSGAYSQAQGTAVLNNQGGLTPTPLGPVVADDFMLFNARSMSGSVSTRLFRRILISGSYSRFSSSVAEYGSSSDNSGSRYNFRSEYRLRKFSLLGGFNHSSQEVSFVPGGPRVVNSYYLSLSRWFNVF